MRSPCSGLCFRVMQEAAKKKIGTRARIASLTSALMTKCAVVDVIATKFHKVGRLKLEHEQEFALWRRSVLCWQLFLWRRSVLCWQLFRYRLDTLTKRGGKRFEHAELPWMKTSRLAKWQAMPVAFPLFSQVCQGKDGRFFEGVKLISRTSRSRPREVWH